MSTLSNARDVLLLMAQSGRELTVTDVSVALGVPKSSASRTLSQMAHYQFLERNPVTLGYRPGPLILESAAGRTLGGVVPELMAAVTELVSKTGYTGYLNVLDGGETIVIYMRPGEVGQLQVYTPEGTRGVAYGTSAGRAMLARLDDQSVAALVGTSFSHAHGSAPRSLAELLARLAVVRVEGYATSDGEIVENVGGVAAAVLDPGSERPYSLGVALPSDDLDARPDVAHQVLSAAHRVGSAIGDPFWRSFPASRLG